MLYFFHSVGIFDAGSIGRKERDRAKNGDNGFVDFLGGHSVMESVDFLDEAGRNTRLGDVKRMLRNDELVCVDVEQFV